MKTARKISLVLLVISCLLIIAVFIPPVGWNPGGGLTPAGILLSLTAGTAIVLAFIHTWRRPYKFLILMGGSIPGFGLFVVLHNLLYACTVMTSHIVLLRHLFEFLHVVGFLVAIFVCPVVFLASAAGSTVTCLNVGLTSTKISQKLTYLLLAVCCIALIVAFFVLIVAKILN